MGNLALVRVDNVWIWGLKIPPCCDQMSKKWNVHDTCSLLTPPLYPIERVAGLLGTPPLPTPPTELCREVPIGWVGAMEVVNFLVGEHVVEVEEADIVFAFVRDYIAGAEEGE